jgi:hypothetical protein
VSGLFRPDELYSTGEFFRSKFGRDAPEQHEVHHWRLAETQQFLGSAPFAITNYFKIADKDGNLVSMEPFTGQAILSVCIESQRRQGYPQRVVEDKPRQIGWTSWCLGEALHNILHPNRKSIVLVNDEDVAAAKATILGTMVNGLPPHMQPMRRIQNMKHIVFENPNAAERIYNAGLNSELQITVPSGMRGTTPHLVIISEYAFMDDARKEEVNSGLLTGMGLRKESAVIIDTTANGFDDDYYPMMMEAAEENPRWVKRLETMVNVTAAEIFAGKYGQPDNLKTWVPAFSRWCIHDEYTTRNENPRGELPRIRKADLDELMSDLGKNPKYSCEEEMQYAEQGVSAFRLYWRRWKIDSIKQPSQELKLLIFRQEFPDTIAGSFVNYQKSPFDRECLDVVVKQGRDTPYKGILREDSIRGIYLDSTFHSDWQEMRLYAPPQQGEKYTMGVDTGVRYASKDADAWVAQVLRLSDYSVVATYEARVDEHTFREQLMYLYRWYNHAYTGIELQGSGFRIIRECIDSGMRNYYEWKRLDSDFPEPTKYPGWDTNQKTRPIMDDAMVELICHRDPMTNRPEPLITIRDIPTLNELQTVRRQATGAIKADSGHDDHYDALAIAVAIAGDPWTGLSKLRGRKKEEPVAEKVDNFAAFRRGSSSRRSRRNEPDIANL